MDEEVLKIEMQRFGRVCGSSPCLVVRLNIFDLADLISCNHLSSEVFHQRLVKFYTDFSGRFRIIRM